MAEAAGEGGEGSEAEEDAEVKIWMIRRKGSAFYWANLGAMYTKHRDDDDGNYVDYCRAWIRKRDAVEHLKSYGEVASLFEPFSLEPTKRADKGRRK